MIVMEAAMVVLPFSADQGKGSVLHTLVESAVPVETFGSETVKAIIDYKWRRFARRQIYTKGGVYLLFVTLFTVYAILYSDDKPHESLKELVSYDKGRASVVLSGARW